MNTYKVDGVEYRYKDLIDNEDGTFTLTGIEEIVVDSPHTCSPDKALMRVVEKTRRMTPEEEEQLFRGFEYYEVIQTICGCGKVLSSNEIKE